MKFQSCKPSAHYQLPLLSGCTGQCEYCYLNTNLSDKPYTRVNVNIDDIFTHAQKYIDERLPEQTIFEGSATSDPVPVEPYSNSLKQTIQFFSKSENGRFRFVTKYPVGFIIAPIFLYDDWKTDYKNLLINLKNSLSGDISPPLTFEVISHRYTTRAKNTILEVFPKTELPMNNDDRTYKYGQFGYGKFVYAKKDIGEYFHIVLGEYVYSNIGYLAGTPQGRTSDLMSMFENPKVKEIIPTRGGVGVVDIIPYLDYSIINTLTVLEPTVSV